MQFWLNSLICKIKSYFWKYIFSLNILLKFILKSIKWSQVFKINKLNLFFILVLLVFIQKEKFINILVLN